MVYAVEGPTIVEGGYTYPAVKEDGVWIADAYLHDPAVLPHQVPGDLNLLFPKAVAAEEFPEVPEETDVLEQNGVRNTFKVGQASELHSGTAGNGEFCDSVGSSVLPEEHHRSDIPSLFYVHID